MKFSTLLKTIIMLIGLNSTLGAVNLRWVPIAVDGITIFVPYGQVNELKTIKDVYKPDDIVSVKVNAALSGDQDWVGVYPKNKNNAWGNVVAWNWIPNNGTFALSDIKKAMPVGAYEARLFFHNQYNVKASYPFSVSTDTFKTIKTQYNVNEEVSVMVNVPLSGKKDWVGIYPKNANNSWENVIAWNWITSKGTFALTKDKKAMPAGEYEAKLFFNNSYDDQQTFGFSVTGGDKKYPKTSTYYKRDTNQTIPEPTVENPSLDNEFETKLSLVKQPNGEYYPAPDYPKIQVWNSDMSLVRIKNRLYDAHTLKETAITKNLTNTDADEKLGSRYGSSFRWSAKDPNKFYIINNPKFQLIEGKINGTAISEEILYDFKNNDYKKVDMSNGEGNIDFNDQYIALPVQKLNDNRIYIFLYDLQKKKPVWNEPKLYDNPNATWKEVPDDFSPYTVFDWVTVSPSGKYIVINDHERGILRYDINFRNKKELQFRGYNGQLVSEAGHGDICYNTRGQEVFVSFVANRGTKGIYSFNLDNPNEEGKRIINEYRGGGHVSCRNTLHKGWAYITTREEGYAEVYALKLDGTDNETVQRFFQTHAKDLNSVGASASPDGTKVIFSNTWGTHNNKDIKAFIAEAQ